MNSPITNAAPASNGQVVVFPPDRGIGVLAITAPYPLGFKPQNDGALGININMVHGDRDGLLVYILAYLNMAVGDYIKVFIETKNTPVAQFPVTEAHFDAQGGGKNIPFYISADTLLAKFSPLQLANKNFWVEIKRVSGNTEESPPVPLLYKYPAPGEADTDGGKPFNQGLKLPVASESVVDQTVINDGLFVTVPAYFNQHIGDVVVLAFGSLLLESTVTELGDVVFELTPEMLATLAPTSSLVVRWEVFDVVENSSGWSDALILTFKPGMVLLAAPIFEQADPDNVVNHDGLAGGAMVILVTGVFAINDLIKLTVEGLTKGGDPATRTFSVTLAAASRALDFPVPNEWVRNLIGGSARASYTLTRAGKLQRSKPADATFTGTSLTLGPPIVSPLVDNKLPVDTATATVQVAEYWPLKTGATVKLKWQTTDQDGIATLFIFQQLVTDPAQPIIFQVPAKYIAPYASTPLTVQCTVTNAGEVEVFSGLLQLMFGDATQIAVEPPKLVSPATNPLDPLRYTHVSVRVDHAAAVPGDKARLYLLNPLPGSPAFVDLPLDQKFALFTLDATFLGLWQGKVPQLAWKLIKGEQPVAESGPLVLTVNRIADGDSRLPTPTIEGRTGSELDVTQLVAGDTLSIAQWLLQVAGRYVWLRCDGFNNSGAPIFFDVLDGVLHNETQGLTQSLGQALVDWFKTLKHGTPATITFRVNYSGARDLLTAVAFPVRTYMVKAEPDIPELIVDPSLLSLKGENYTFSINFSPYNNYTGDDALGTAANRGAKGGVPPYTYESLEPKIATADPKGVIRSEGNGRTTIVVRDAAGQQKSFDVETANVTHVEYTPRTTLAAARAYISQVGGFMIANSLTSPSVQIASRRISGHTIRIGIMVEPPYQGQITISKTSGGALRFGVSTLHADGTAVVEYWTNKPSS